MSDADAFVANCRAMLAKIREAGQLCGDWEDPALRELLEDVVVLADATEEEKAKIGFRSDADYVGFLAFQLRELAQLTTESRKRRAAANEAFP